MRAVSRVRRVGACNSETTSPGSNSLLNCRPASSTCLRPSSVRGRSPSCESTLACRTQRTRSGAFLLMVPHSFLDQRKSAGWSTINTCEMVAWRKELAARGQLSQVDEAFDQRNVRIQDGLVDNKLVCRPSWFPGCRFLEEVAANALRLLLHKPASCVFCQPWRLGKVDRRANRSLCPICAQQDNISRFDRFLLSPDRKSTRLNSSHQIISYAVFC